MKKKTTVRLNPTIHADLKATCDDAKVSMSKTIQTLIALFLKDHSHQERVLNAVRKL
jgi:predicted HicB family RNase H-like nuclease